MMRAASLIALIAVLAGTAPSQPRSRVHLTTYRGRIVPYEVHGRYAVIEGDVIIGEASRMPAPELLTRDSAIFTPPNPALYRWPNGVIPYEIDPALPNQQRVIDAVDHWNTRTPLKLTPHSSEADYVRFTPGAFDAACESAIGMRGGAQDIVMTDACTAGNLIHEIGHAFGLEHEQNRPDRNAYVTILYENIDKRYRLNFDPSPGTVSAAGYYDYDSIMHYSPTAFSVNFLDTIETVPAGIPIGQTTALSAGDIDAVSRLYGMAPATTTITTIPAGLAITVDGETAMSPQSYTWARGSTHTVSVTATQGVDPRHIFVRWTDGGASSHTITASADVTAIAAIYVRQHRAASGVSSGSGDVRFSPASADGYYPERAQVAISETPSSGSEFLRWVGNTNFNANGLGTSVASAILRLTLPNAQYLAQFVTAPVTTIDSTPPGRTVTVDGTAYLTPARFTWNPGTSHTLSVAATQNAANNTRRYQFQGWDDGSSGDRVVMAGSSTAAYTARFNTQYLLTTAAAGAGRITVDPASADNYYDAGSTVQVTALPDAGSAFREWVGDASTQGFTAAGGAAVQTFIMDEDKFAVAVFASQFPFRLVNSASNSGRAVYYGSGVLVAPGELVTLYGNGIGPPAPANGVVVNNALSTSAGGVRVLFDGRPAPVVYASANQINAVVPGVVGSTSSTTLVQLERNGVTQVRFTVSAGDVQPALFTADGSGTGQVAALNQDGLYNGPNTPAEHGSVVALYATGAGLLASDVADGAIMGSTLVRTRAPVYVRVGKLPAEVLYAGSAPGLVNGVIQVNVRLPGELIGGPAVPIQLLAGPYRSQIGATIAVR